MTIYRCTASGVFPSGRVWSTRLHFTSGSTVGQVESDWQTAFQAAWSTIASPLKALYPAGTILTATKTEQLAVVAVSGTPVVNKLRSQAIASDTMSIAGTSANPALPDANCLLVSLRTATPGRGGSGRSRLPAPDQTLVTAGAVSSTTAGHVTTALSGIRSSMAAAGHTEVLVTYTLTKALVAVGSTRVVTSEKTDEVIRSVRVRSKSRTAVYV